MPIINMSNYYKGEHLNTVSIVGDQVVSAQIEANVYRRCIEEGREYSGFNMNRVIANSEAHLKGVYSCMLGKEVEYDDVTVEDVRNIADRFMVDGNRYHTRGGAINETNYRNVLFEISMLTTAGLTAHSSAPRIGFLDAKNEPLTVFPDVLVPEEPTPVTAPKKPGWFKTFMNKHFNLFKDTFAKYDNDVDEYNRYVDDYNRYMEKRERAESISEENKKQSEELCDEYKKEIISANAKEEARQLDSSFVKEIAGNMLGTTNAVEATASLNKAKESK